MYNCAAVIGINMLVAVPAYAEFPERAVTISAASAPGSPGDAIMRVIKDDMQAALGQPIIIENRDGAGGSAGAAAVARMEPNGYNILMSGSGPMVFSPMLLDGVSYKYQDFTPSA